MKTKCYATIQNGKIIELTEGSHAIELRENQVPLTSNELAILRILDGDIQYGRNILRDIEQRIKDYTK